MNAAARRIVRFAAKLRLADIPAPVVTAAKLHFLDAIGVGLAASTVPPASSWADGARRIGGGGGPASLLGRTGGLSATMAALVNGALIHSLEYDDTHIGSVVHGSPESAGRLSAHLDNLGTVWHLPDVAFKLYPCCHYIHPFLEAMQMLINDGLHPGDVAAITCHVPPPMVPLICEPWGRRQRPASGYDGKWGLAYCLAALLMGDRVDVATFATPPDPKIVDAARRIEWLPMESHTFPRRFEALVEVQSHDGRAFHHRIDSVRGAPDRPVAEAEVVAKFRANAGRAMTDGAVEIARLVILTLDHARTLAPLTEALRNIRRWSNPFTSSGWVGTTRCWGR